jgi:hypothetical protein
MVWGTTVTWGGFNSGPIGRWWQGQRARPRGAQPVAQGEWGRKVVRRKCGGGGSTARGPADLGRPRRAGPERPRHRSVCDAGVARDAERVGAVGPV